MKPQIIETLREFNTRNFHIVIDAVEDYDIDLSGMEDADEIIHSLERGTLVAFTVRAIAYCHGSEVASDYLGGCIYKTPREFMDHIECGAQNRKYAAAGESGRCGSYFKDMVSNVCRDARAELRKLQTVRVRT